MIAMLTTNDYLFYVLGAISLFCGFGVILSRNPLYSALYLVATMVSISGIFVTLNAYFIAGVQLIVYAGAVMVLFVMVLMLFDLKQEAKVFSRGAISNVLKLASAGVLLGMLLIFIGYTFSADPGFKPLSEDPTKVMETTRTLSTAIFTRYIFGFEAIGVLLLIIAIGAVTLSRIAGGTHAD
jgi:NADH-quinone oxidoreductase subunit J